MRYSGRGSRSISMRSFWPCASSDSASSTRTIGSGGSRPQTSRSITVSTMTSSHRRVERLHGIEDFHPAVAQHVVRHRIQDAFLFHVVLLDHDVERVGM